MNIKLPFPRRSVASRGKAIYQKKILPLVYPQETGKIVVIDISSGDYEIDADDAQALVRLLARRPHARTWTERIGYRAVDSIGGGVSLNGGN